MAKTKITRAMMTKEVAREALRILVMREMEEMVAAQVELAKGLKRVVVRTSDGSIRRASERHVKGERLEVWIDAPSTAAFKDLMDRTIDKPKEQEQAVAVSGGLVLRWQNTPEEE